MAVNILTYLIIGLALLGMTSLPRYLEKHPLTLPLVYVALGAVLFSLPLGLKPLEIGYQEKATPWVEYLTELIVIISLACAGLKIDRTFSFQRWSLTWRLLGVIMVPSIIVVALGAHWLLGLAPASALLLGAVLAPTDPVLAEEIQVGTPHEGEEDQVRFGLTTEASFNDALAFPFIYLAIAATGKDHWDTWLWQWFAWDFCYRILVGIAGGLLVGWLATQFLLKHSDMGREKQATQEAREGTEFLFVLAAICLTYSLTEIAEGYGFLAVFVAATVWKKKSPEEFSRTLYRSASQLERLLLAGMLIGLGGMIVADLDHLADWRIWALALTLIFLIRPLFGYLATAFSGICSQERVALAFFGIRGLGSVYYLAYAVRKASFPEDERIWSATAACIVVSVTIHGLSANPVMSYLDRVRDQKKS